MQGNVDFLAAQQQSSAFPQILLLIVIVAAFYFFLIRPQNRRRREQAQMQNSVAQGARVITTSGMYATVTAVEDDHLVLELAPGVEARFLKQAVMQVLSDDPDDAEDTENTEDIEGAEGTEEAESVEGAKNVGAESAGGDEQIDLTKNGDVKSNKSETSKGRTPEQPSA